MSKPLQRNLDEWLFLLENRHSQEIQLGLERVRQAAEELNLLNPDCFVITVAGTNGKGSTVALLESIYKTAGYCVASYTSPHLLRFNERIKINQQPISDAELINAFEAVEQVTDFNNLTYFEVTTLAALRHFQQQQLDLIILEVGLGGRLDATNIIDCDLAIITTIAIDHEAYLGNTIEAIGYEKAGILRTNKPFIYADKLIPQSILKHALSLNTPLYRNEQEYSYQVIDNTMCLSYQNQKIDFPLPPFHSNSVAAAVMATMCLQSNFPVTRTQCAQGVKNTTLAGRLQVFHQKVHTLFDVAHNPQAACYLAAHITKFYPGIRVHAVFSAFADKDLQGLVSPLKEIVSCWYPSVMPGKRAASESQLLSVLNAREVTTSVCYNDPVFAYQAACHQALANDLIVVYGSFIMVGLVLSTLPDSIPFKEII